MAQDGLSDIPCFSGYSGYRRFVDCLWNLDRIGRYSKRSESLGVQDKNGHQN
jgi:hypothetical protein